MAAPPDEGSVPGLEERLAEIVVVITDLAALRFDARATVTTVGDMVDAVAAGVNALGEELAASYEEMEQRVADRTADLALLTQELRRRALHDDLTGLSNRPAFWDRLTHRMQVAERRATGFAVLFIDLDDFKQVNDTYGHAAGDQLLVAVARRISRELRAGDTVARVGGDEFLVLLDEVASAEAALAVARRLGDCLDLPHEIDGHRFTSVSSIGVAVGGVAGAGLPETPDALVAAADIAMYDAKHRGGGTCVLYSTDRHANESSPVGGR